MAIEDLTVTPPYYGNRVSERKYLAVLNQETYVLSDIPLAEGILKRFFVYLQKPLEGGTGAEPSPNAKAMLQIWRPENAISSELNRVYTLVYSIPVGLNASIGPNGTMSTVSKTNSTNSWIRVENGNSAAYKLVLLLALSYYSPIHCSTFFDIL